MNAKKILTALGSLLILASTSAFAVNVSPAKVTYLDDCEGQTPSRGAKVEIKTQEKSISAIIRGNAAANMRQGGTMIHPVTVRICDQNDACEELSGAVNLRESISFDRRSTWAGEVTWTDKDKKDFDIQFVTSSAFAKPYICK